MMEINLNNLAQNVKVLTNGGKKLIGVVKNNAYGCGSLKVSQQLVKCGVDYLLVNDLSEALVLLENGINAKIIIFNGIKVSDYPYLGKYQNLVVSINSLADCLNLQTHCSFPVHVHLQIDTGLNRFGIKDFEEFKEVMKLLTSNNKFKLEGIYTHFASTNTAKKQLEMFKSYAEVYPFQMVHCASSSTYQTIDYGNYIRCGLALYDLSPVMAIKCYPLGLRNVNQGETIGYNGEYVATESIMIAILPVGYGNGYRLGLKGFYVYASGKYYQVIGRVCMNHIFVKVDDEVTLDTEFSLMSEQIPAEKLANFLNTSKYEIYTNWKFDKVRYIE